MSDFKELQYAGQLQTGSLGLTQLSLSHKLWELCKQLTPGPDAAHPLASELHQRLSQATGDAAGKRLSFNRKNCRCQLTALLCTACLKCKTSWFGRYVVAYNTFTSRSAPHSYT